MYEQALAIREALVAANPGDAFLMQGRDKLKAALAKCCEGVSRRTAALIKGRVLTRMENERRAELTRVFIAPGAVAGFDAMHFLDGFLLVSADAGMAYRRALEAVDDYVGPLVAWVLDEDFTKNGAPLVARVDRAKQHLTCEVLDVKESGIDVQITGTDFTTFIKRSELARDRNDQRAERFAVGEKVDARVIQFDKKARKVQVSIKALEVAEEKEAIAQYGSSDSGATLGDILGTALKNREK